MGVVSLRRSLSLSVVFHFLVLIGVWMWMTLAAKQAALLEPKRVTWIEVEPNRPLEKKESQNKQRIVQTDRAQETQVAAPDANLGERTQTVDRQTVSKERTTRVAKAARPAAEPSAADSKTGQKQDGIKELSKLALPIIPHHHEGNVPERRRDFFESSDMARPQDYVKGFKESESTLLNTKEYVFFGYFQRIRERLDRAWSGALRDQLAKFYKRGRRLASDTDHQTRLMVTLDREGQIIRVQILEASGTVDLDDAAIKAFNQAGPFPNPPTGLIDTAGRVDIRWDFILRT